jgi:cupin 2 domain-containing protein
MAKENTVVPPTLNILAPLPVPVSNEAIETLLSGDGIRMERIVSYGQSSPPGFWYDQEQAEWVLVVHGRARLTIEGEAQDRELGPGDSLFLPAHCRHRVAWTQPDQPTVWLTIFIAPRLAPKPGGA